MSTPASSPYNADYFLRGKEKGISLYEDYRWMPELTGPMVGAIISHLGIEHTDTILDFGCARGYTVRAFREMGYVAHGYDVSEWAICNADPKVLGFVTNDFRKAFPSGEMLFDWIIAKDVLEHVADIETAIVSMVSHTRKGVFVVVPLSYGSGYVIPEYEEDVTHVHRWPLLKWAAKFTRPGWAVTVQYRLPGVKDNYAKYEYGNGFVTARRIA